MPASVSLLESAGAERKPLRPGRPLAGIRARLLHGSLDRALAAGADPASARALARRAARLTSRRNREHLGRSLARILRDARGRKGLSSRIMPARGEIFRAWSELERIHALLLSATPLYTRGVARLGLLITNGVGPLYSPAYRGHLTDELEGLALALEGRQERW